MVLVLAGLAAFGSPAVAAAGAAGPARLPIDPARSALTFVISRPGETIEGNAPGFSGEVTLDHECPGEGASVLLTVRAGSLVTGNRIRDRKMRNSHLEVEAYPEIVFRSTSIQVGAGSAGAMLRQGEERRALIEGILALHGVDRTIQFPATIRYDSGSFTAEGEAVIRLTDHSIPIPRIFWIVLDDEVKVRFRFVATSPAG
jgi:polyisoprenoid-binding protein YceI